MCGRRGRSAAGLLPALLLVLVPATGGQERALPRPGTEHAMLKQEVGTWEAVIEMWMGAGEPVESRGVETNKRLGDLWLITEFEGEVGGMPFRGHGQTGYDTVKKRFVAIWVDTFTTSPSLLEGRYDDATGELTLVGETTGPDGTKAHMKNVSRHNPDGTCFFTLSMKGEMTGGEWVKPMEVTYTRRGAGTR